jgi:hypothetical protein
MLIWIFGALVAECWTLDSGFSLPGLLHVEKRLLKGGFQIPPRDSTGSFLPTLPYINWEAEEHPQGTSTRVSSSHFM